MLRWALGFLIPRLNRRGLRIGGIAAALAGIAKMLFFLFLIIFVVTLIMGVMAGRKVTGL